MTPEHAEFRQLGSDLQVTKNHEVARYHREINGCYETG